MEKKREKSSGENILFEMGEKERIMVIGGKCKEKRDMGKKGVCLYLFV